MTKMNNVEKIIKNYFDNYNKMLIYTPMKNFRFDCEEYRNNILKFKCYDDILIFEKEEKSLSFIIKDIIIEGTNKEYNEDIIFIE